MESSTDFIFPIPPTGKGRRLALGPMDQLINWPINCVFIYPSLDINKLKRVLEHTLSIWPVVCGHIEVDNASENLREGLHDLSIL